MKVAAVVQSLEGPDESDDLQVKWHSDKSVGESGSIGSLIPPSPPAPIILLTAAPNSLYLSPFRNSRVPIRMRLTFPRISLPYIEVPLARSL